MELLSQIISSINSVVWSFPVIVFIVLTGLYFSIRLNWFQIIKNSHMWKAIFKGGDSDSGISPFSAFCTAMAMRIGTGNIAGVALAVFRGGPGTLFWMWVVGILNSAISFVECSLSQLYKTKIDGEYRGSGAYCAERGLGQRWLGCILSIVLGITAAFFMPAAGTYTISNLFNTAAGVPNWVTSGILAIMLGVIIFGGVKRIGKISSILVPIKVLVYFGCFLLILGFNITKVPQMFVDIFSCAFSVDAAVWGGIAYAFMQGCNRGTFACAAGMGEAMPAAAASETNHPVKQGFVNAGGVWICVIGVCTCTGFMILLTDCYCTDFGYVGAGVAGLAQMDPADASYVAAAVGTIIGSTASEWLIAILLLLFVFTSVIGYYYEAETSFLFMFQGEGKEKIRKYFQIGMKLVMIALVVFYGVVESSIA